MRRGGQQTLPPDPPLLPKIGTMIGRFPKMSSAAANQRPAFRAAASQTPVLVRRSSTPELTFSSFFLPFFAARRLHQGFERFSHLVNRRFRSLTSLDANFTLLVVLLSCPFPPSPPSLICCLGSRVAPLRSALVPDDIPCVRVPARAEGCCSRGRRDGLTRKLYRFRSFTATP